MKNPGKFGPASVIGQYLRMMHINQYKKYTFADSDRLNAPPKEEQEIKEDEQAEQELKEKLEAGEISQAEYQTLSTTTAHKGNSIDFVEMDEPIEEETPEIPTTFGQAYAKDESYWTNQLTQEDIDYLILKWGVMYDPKQ